MHRPSNMSQKSIDDIQEPVNLLTGSDDADSESSSDSTVISVHMSNETITTQNPELQSYSPNESPETPAEKDVNAEKSLVSDDSEGDKLRQSEIERLRKVFQEKGSHDLENSSDFEKSISRSDFSDAESVSSTEMEVIPRPKLLSDYTLDFLHCVRKKDTSERDYMWTKAYSTNKTFGAKDRRKTLGKRKEPYSLQTDSKIKKYSYSTNVKSNDCTEDKRKQDTGHSNITPTKMMGCEICPHETLRGSSKNSGGGLKPENSKVKLKDDSSSNVIHCATTHLRDYRVPTRIPMPKTRRDMEGILKAADDQFNSLDAELSFLQQEINEYEKEPYEKGHTLEIIEESSFETTCRDDMAEETLRNDDEDDREPYGNIQVDEDIPEKVSDVSLDRNEYTVDLIEEALKEVSKQTLLEPIEEEQPFTFENRDLDTAVINITEEVMPETGIALIDSEQHVSSDELEEESDSDTDNKVECSIEEIRDEAKDEFEPQTHALMRVSLARSALMKYAARFMQPITVNENVNENNACALRCLTFDDSLTSYGDISENSICQVVRDTDSDFTNDVSSEDGLRTKSTSDAVDALVPLSQAPTETSNTDRQIVCSENNIRVLNEMLRNIPLEQLSLDDQCVVANISSQQYTVYIKLKNKDEGSSEDHTPALGVQEVSLIEEMPNKMLTFVTQKDPKACSDPGRVSLQIKPPRRGKEVPKIEARETKTCHLRSKFREKLIQSRTKKAKPAAISTRQSKQRIKPDFPVKQEETFFHEDLISKDNIYEREVKRRLNKKNQEGRYSKRISMPLHVQNCFPKESESSLKPSVHKMTSLKSWLSMRQKLAYLENNSTVQSTTTAGGGKTPSSKTPSSKQTQKKPDRRRGSPVPVQTSASVQSSSRRSRGIPQSYVEKVVRDTRSSLLRRSSEKPQPVDSFYQKSGNIHNVMSPRKQTRKVDNQATLHKNKSRQSQCERHKVVKDKPKPRIGQISPTFNRQCYDFISPAAWQINDDTKKFAYFCTPSYNTVKLVEKSDISKFQPKTGSFVKKKLSPRADEVTRQKRKEDCVVSERKATQKEHLRSERTVADTRRTVMDRHGDPRSWQRPALQRKREESKDRSPEPKQYTPAPSVEPITAMNVTTQLENVWSRVSLTCSHTMVMDAEKLKAPIKQHLGEESILVKESIAKDAIENIFKNLNSYIKERESSSESSLKTCPAIHFKHTHAGDIVSSEDDIHADIDSDEEMMCDSESNFVLSTKEMRLLAVKQKIRKEPLVSDLKWSLLVAACHGYNFDKYLTPFPEHFVQNGRKDIDALMQATEEVPSLSLLCNLSVNEISPPTIQLLYWLLVDLNSVKVVATSTREAESSISRRPDAVFSVWQQPSSLLDKRLRSSGRGLPKVEAFCSARLDKYHALLHGVMVPSGVMRRNIDMALLMAKPGYSYGCSTLGSKIKCIARCQVSVHPRLVELTEEEATVRGRNLVRVQQLLVFRDEEEVQQTFRMPNWCHVVKLVMVVMGLHMVAFGLLWVWMSYEPTVKPEPKGPDFSEAFPWLASL